ncbi:hypothetical protein BH11PSE11_BH11PSE11_15570 [soil metagenome]
MKYYEGEEQSSPFFISGGATLRLRLLPRFSTPMRQPIVPTTLRLKS